MMARKVNDVSAEQLRKTTEPSEPSLDSRVSGLEYRVAHPNHRSLDQILSNVDDGVRFRVEVERCRQELGIGTLGEIVARLKAEEGEPVKKDSTARPIIWGALLGAALALAVLAICNPAAFHRSLPVAAVTMSAAKNENLGTLAFGNATSGRVSGTVTLQAPPATSIRATPTVDCWMSIKDAEDHLVVEKTVKAYVMVILDSPPPPLKFPLEIRSGCPGQVVYEVDGSVVSPVNQSKKPDKSEVVTLP